MGHVFNFYKTRIVGEENLELKKKISEVINFSKHEDNANFKTNTASSSGAYRSMIERFFAASLPRPSTSKH